MRQGLAQKIPEEGFSQSDFFDIPIAVHSPGAPRPFFAKFIERAVARSNFYKPRIIGVC